MERVKQSLGGENDGIGTDISTQHDRVDLLQATATIDVNSGLKHQNEIYNFTPFSGFLQVLEFPRGAGAEDYARLIYLLYL